MLEYQGALPPDEIYSTLESTAADMKTAGFDFDSGFGLVQADAAVAGGIPVQFSEATYSVSEAGPTAKITVTRTMGIDKSVSVNYATSDGTATAGKDYKTTSGTLTFKAGQTSKTFTIPIINDTLNEQNETVNLNLSNPTGGAILGTPSTATLNIVDNDPAGSVQFSAATYSVSEAKSTATITIKRMEGTASGVTVDYATSDGTATAGKDYKTTKTTSGTLTFKAGQTSKTFTIPIINDTLNEQNETVNLNLSNPAGGAILGTPSTATLNIVDNDPAGSVQFSAATYSVSEAKTTATITIKRTAGTASGVTVDYATSDGTATADNDYTTKSGTLIFNARQNSKTFTIPIINDNFHEANEAFNLNLSNPTGGAALGMPDMATLTIVDNDPAN
jgi:hypothetical protein